MQWSPVPKAELPAYLKKQLPCSLLQLYSADAADSRLILNQHRQHLPEKSKQLPRPQQRPLQLQLQQNCCNWLGKLTFLNRILR